MPIWLRDIMDSLENGYVFPFENDQMCLPVMKQLPFILLFDRNRFWINASVVYNTCQILSKLTAAWTNERCAAVTFNNMYPCYCMPKSLCVSQFQIECALRHSQHHFNISTRTSAGLYVLFPLSCHAKSLSTIQSLSNQLWQKLK